MTLIPILDTTGEHIIGYVDAQDIIESINWPIGPGVPKPKNTRTRQRPAYSTDFDEPQGTPVFDPTLFAEKNVATGEVTPIPADRYDPSMNRTFRHR